MEKNTTYNMKIKNYSQLLNEGFFNKKGGDDFTKKLLDIVEKENIKITYNFDDHDDDDDIYTEKYIFIVDNIKYYLSNYHSPTSFTNKYNINIDGDNKKISKNLYKRIEQIYKYQNTKNELPDLSDIGRSSKKFNI